MAGCVKKIVANHRPNQLGELDLDYNAGAAWMGDTQLAGMGPSSSSGTTSLNTRGGAVWVDEVGLAKLLKVSRQTVEDEVRNHRF